MPRDDVRFHDALREAIEVRNLPLERVSAHLRARGHTISIATLSYWQSGRSVPGRSTSIRALGSLEQVLGVPRGELARRVPASPAGRGRMQSVAMADVDAQMAVIDRVVSELGRSMDDTVEIVSGHFRSFVDEDRAIMYGHVREIVTAIVPQPDSYVTAGWNPIAGHDVVITPLAGCALTRMVSRPKHSICVAELALPPLPLGGHHIVEYEIGFPTVTDRFFCDRAVACITAPMRELVVEVNFPSGDLPHAVRRLDGDAAEQEPTRTTLRTVHRRMAVARTNFGPGTLGLEWDVPGVMDER